jgi:hypothetical protein
MPINIKNAKIINRNIPINLNSFIIIIIYQHYFRITIKRIKTVIRKIRMKITDEIITYG